MIFASCSDIHFTDKVPENRTDTYVDDQFRKFESMLKVVRKKANSKLLLVGGDFFETVHSPYSLVYRIMLLLNKYKDIKIVGVAGQHDLRYHVSGLKNTPLGILVKAGYVTILSNNKPYVHRWDLSNTKRRARKGGGKISIIGAGWNEDPEAEADIVVTHRMVTYKKPLWPGQTDYSTAKAMLKKWPWAKCIISGDNHKPHVADFADSGLQINCGSLMRSTKAQVDHKPCVWLIDSADWGYRKHGLGCLPSEEAFDFAKIEKAEKQEEAKLQADKDMDEFISSLSVKDEERPKFKNVLKEVIKKRNPSQNQRAIINEIMEECGNESNRS